MDGAVWFHGTIEKMPDIAVPPAQCYGAGRLGLFKNSYGSIYVLPQPPFFGFGLPFWDFLEIARPQRAAAPLSHTGNPLAQPNAAGKHPRSRPLRSP